MPRVVVTGIGIISPLGIGHAAHWSALLAGTVAVRRFSLFDPAGFPTQIGGEVPPYKIGDFVPKSYRKATKVMARDIELAVVAADDAFKHSGIATKAYSDSPAIDPRRAGCNIGAGLISAELNELTAAMSTARDPGDANRLDLATWGQAGMQQLTPLWLLKYLPNMLACHVTIIHGLKGPSNTITCADASSHLAIGEAFRTIQRGKADVAICGGSESKANEMALVRQSMLGRLTTAHNDSPAQAVRPFDHHATGTAVAEGGGLLILESLDHATKRGANILAEVVGFGASQDVHNIRDPDPTGHSYSRAVLKSLAEANLPPSAVDLLVPHGTGIPAADRAELAGLSLVFGNGLARVAMSPLKAQTGSIGAGSGVDAATAVLALHHGVIPPAVNSLKTPGLNVAATAREARLNAVVSSVYSLGGQNASIVFKRLA